MGLGLAALLLLAPAAPGPQGHCAGPLEAPSQGPPSPKASLSPGSPPQRLISLAPALTKNLYLLGAGDRLVGNTLYCVTPPEAATKEKVGTVVQANLERIVSLRPDLVLATPLIHPDQVAKLQDLGLPVEVFPYPRDFSEICGQFLHLGGLLGLGAEAARVVARVRAEVEEIQGRVKALGVQRVFVQIGSKPLFTVTAESFVNDYIRFAGGINVAGGHPSGIYSREEVILGDPEIILIAGMGAGVKKEKEAWMRYRSIAAVKNGRIHVVDPEDVCGPSPASFVEVLRELLPLIHPELRGEVRKP